MSTYACSLTALTYSEQIFNLHVTEDCTSINLSENYKYISTTMAIDAVFWRRIVECLVNIEWDMVRKKAVMV